MEHAVDLFIGKLLEHGPWGFLVAWLMYTNWRLNNRLDLSNSSVEAMLLRHADQREKSGEVMAASAAAMTQVSSAVKILSDRIEDNGSKIVNMTTTNTALCERINHLDQSINDLDRRSR